MADFNRNQVGENGLAKIAEDLSLVRLKSTDTIGSIAQIEGLQDALDGKAASSHTHTIGDITNLQDELDGKAASSHTHTIGTITGRQNLVIQLNSGTTENTNQFTYNAGTAKKVNITASKIGAAASTHSHNVATTSKAGFLSASDKSKLDSLTIQGDTSGYVSKSGDQMYGPLLFKATHYYNRGHFEGIGSGSFATSAASTSFYAEVDLSNFNQNKTSLSLRFNGYNHNNPRVRIDFTVGILITYSSGTRAISSTNGWYSEGMLTPSSVTARISGSTLYIYYNFATLANYYTANSDNIFVRVDAIIHDAPENGITGLSARVGTETPPTSGLTTLTKLAIASGTYVSWANITGKPSTFAPSSHDHEIGDITNLQDELDGKAASSHTAVKATSSVLGHVKVDTAMSSTSTNPVQNKVVNTALAGKAASNHTHKYAGSASAGGAATSANKVNSSLKIQLNGGTTENTNLFTFNGSAVKTVNITASKVGAALASNFGICNTAAATAAKEVEIAGFSLVNGVEIAVKFTNDNTESHPKLNVNGTGAKNIIYMGGEFNYLQANRIYNFRFVQTSSTAGVGNWELVSSPYSYYAYSSTKATNATKWETSRVLNGLSVNGTRNLVNFGICSTAGTIAAKTITINNGSYFSLSTGAEVTVKFTNTNTVSGLTLNVNGTGAKYIYYRGNNIPYHVILANKLYTFRYDGSYWQLVGNASSLNKTYLTYENLGTSSGSPGPDNIDDLIIDNELNYLDIYVSSAATAARYYLKIPDKEVGTIIDIGIRKNVNNKKLQAVQLAREGNAGPTIYLPDGSGGYPNVDIAVGTFVRLYRADENGWIMYRYATV